MKVNGIKFAMESIMLKKFRGCLLGVLTGDCLGAPFEGDAMSSGDKHVLNNYMNKLYGPYFKAPVKMYTDDTAMMKCVAQNLINNNGFSAKDLAVKFVREYFADPNRGYGQSIPALFTKLRQQKFADCFAPAASQFDGQGSYGNGGAMRIAPIALFYHCNYDKVIEVATKATKVTHSNELGINGALLQCIAIQRCLELDSQRDELNKESFIDYLIEKIEPIERDEHDIESDNPYKTKLLLVKEFLKHDEITDDEVILTLGNYVSALNSVPTAIYCFLRASTPMGTILTDNPVRRIIQYAISLGGDTDTIANMAASLAGAYYGDDHFSEAIRKHCECSTEILNLADKLYEISSTLDLS